MSLIKPFIAGRRFFSTIGQGEGEGAAFTIAATSFEDDAGNPIAAFPASYAYYNLYINGILQQSGVSSVTTNDVTIQDGNTLDSATPVILEFVVN